ncbi:MAG: GNAT family N-acetyltransferase [Clostridiaceae bacterium]|nr:GNAT family N-acetyltransferase [Eubacteriales bacterium]
MALKKLSKKDRAALKSLLSGDIAANSLLDALENGEDSLCGLWHGDALVGGAALEQGKNAFLYIYIARQFRGKGLGAQALRLCENELKKTAPVDIETYWLHGDENAKAFAAKHGYAYSFSSALMRYSGAAFELPVLPVRGYEDADFTATQELSARAFHEMRLRVGAFPNSTVQKPSEKMRETWKRTAEERFVFVQGEEIIGHARLDGDEIDSVSIKPEAQGKGIGRLFVKHLCNGILKSGYSSVTLYCVVGNWARSLYDSLGFQEEYIEDYAVKTI